MQTIKTLWKTWLGHVPVLLLLLCEYHLARRRPALESIMVYGAVLGTEGISHSAGVALRYAAAVDYVDGDAAETLKTTSDNVVERFLWLYTGLTVKDEHTSLVEECQMLGEKKQKHHGEISKLYSEMKQASPSIKLKKLKNHSKLDNAIANLVANTPRMRAAVIVQITL
jgi:hypothetical protein